MLDVNREAMGMTAFAVLVQEHAVPFPLKVLLMNLPTVHAFNVLQPLARLHTDTLHHNS